MKILHKLGEQNPQLWREIKGRWTPRNLFITLGVSGISQGILMAFFWNQIPKYVYTHRYCFNGVKLNNECLTEATQGILTSSLNYPLWWLDIFITLTILSIALLWIGGTYLIIEDLYREENRGTLAFIRLSPQSSKSILWGKLLGVPSLIIFGILATLPLALGASILAKIPIGLTCSFYGLVAVSCLFIYSIALVIGLAFTKASPFQAWFSSGIVGILFVSLTFFTTGFDNSPDVVTSNIIDWFTILLPQRVLPFLVAKTPHDLANIGYLNVKDLGQLQWFNFGLWEQYTTAYSFTLVNYLMGIYWLWQGLLRRFSNPHATLLSKRESYWFSGGITVLWLGFSVQHSAWGNYEEHLQNNFTILGIFLVILSGGLMAILSPHRQTLQDWARYRHQQPKSQRGLLPDLMWGEKSPATLAIALNWVTISCILGVALWILPGNSQKMLLEILCIGSLMVIYASLVQWILLLKSPQRGTWAIATFFSLVFFPLLVLALSGTYLAANPEIALWSILPVLGVEHILFSTLALNLIGQGLIIALVNLQMSRQLRHLGTSQTQSLLTTKSSSQVQACLR